MSRRFSPEFKAWINGYIPGHTAIEVSDAARKIYRVDISPSQVKSYKANNHIRSGTRLGIPKGSSRIYPPEVLEYIEINRVGKLIPELTDEVNQKFGTIYKSSQIAALLKNKGWPTGVDRKFQKGHTPSNKGTHPPTKGRMGETQFKPGQIPPNKLPVGSEIKRTDGYMQTKIAEPNVWRLTHLINWEREHGPLPDGMLLTFLDGNKENTSVENLTPITRAESLALTRSNLRFEDADLTRAGISVAKVKVAVAKARKGKT